MLGSTGRCEEFKRYYRIVYTNVYGGAARIISAVRATDLKSAIAVGEMLKPEGLRISAVQPVTCDQVRHSIAWLNFKERLW